MLVNASSKGWEEFRPPKYVMLSLDELSWLILCIMLDLAEYAVPILLGPGMGDVLDVLGIGASFLMFGWVGCLSVLELIPIADFLPIFIITWFVWYLMKKRKEREEMEKMQEGWR